MANIDLTDGKAYSRATGLIHVRVKEQGLMALDLGQSKAAVPWKKNEKPYRIHIGTIYSPGIGPLFPTGSSVDIKFIREAVQAELGDRCACCGVVLRVPPWEEKTGLCKQCDAQLGERFGESKLPWEPIRKQGKTVWWFDL